MPDRIHVRVGPDPIDTRAVAARVSDPGCGGNVVFTGTPRTEGEVLFLEYEAWIEEAERVIRALAHDALRVTGAQFAAIEHRTGRVMPEEPSVVVAVSGPHRREAFDACQLIIDGLKRDAPIWKREHSEHGSEWRANQTESA